MIGLLYTLWFFFFFFSITLNALKRKSSQLKDGQTSTIKKIPFFIKKMKTGFQKNPSLIGSCLFISSKGFSLLFFIWSFFCFSRLINAHAFFINNITGFSFVYIIYSLLLTMLLAIVSHLLSKLLEQHTMSLDLLSRISSLPFTLSLFITYPLALLQKRIFPPRPPSVDTNYLKNQLLDLVSAKASSQLNTTQKKLLRSIAHFDEKLCREIMIPRIKIECLQNTSSIFESISMFIEEGYSRIPIFEKSIDHITGMLLYKDVLEYTFKKNLQDVETTQKTPITSLVSPILYAPENKSISDLFQVMRARKIHAAIIVNEYGCTEGLITIEDIFEELIGSEILDEHDEDDQTYKKTHDEGWIIDASFSIIDADREFGIKLPHDSEYETIGGFISTTMGVIPKPGSIVHHDKYRIKVLSSNERKILKIKITTEPPIHIS